MSDHKNDIYANASGAIKDCPGLSTVLVDKITVLIQKNGWTQLEPAKHSRVTQPCNHELLLGRISQYTPVNTAAHLGRRANIEVLAA